MAHMVRVSQMMNSDCGQSESPQLPQRITIYMSILIMIPRDMLSVMPCAYANCWDSLPFSLADLPHIVYRLHWNYDIRIRDSAQTVEERPVESRERKGADAV